MLSEFKGGLKPAAAAHREQDEFQKVHSTIPKGSGGVEFPIGSPNWSSIFECTCQKVAVAHMNFTEIDTRLNIRCCILSAEVLVAGLYLFPSKIASRIF